jgi:4-hydroxy-3-methylbut-2-enyl diphosphate reductase
MNIRIAEHYGLCFGVRDAIARAESMAREAPVTILGQLVHNPIVRDRLRDQGAREGALSRLDSAQTSVVLITAHGAADADRRRWSDAGYQVSDATCPLVHKAHAALARLVSEGFFPVVIGQRGHVEVRGLTGDFPHSHVLESEEDVADLPFQPRYGVISQTTQPLEKVTSIVAHLRTTRPGSEVYFVDTVCQPTKNRQAALRALLAEVEVLVVVGGHNSNNTRQLVAAAETAGRRVHHVERAEELRREWFTGVENVGITAGTSTLRETVAAVAEQLRKLST